MKRPCVCSSVMMKCSTAAHSLLCVLTCLQHAVIWHHIFWSLSLLEECKGCYVYVADHYFCKEAQDNHAVQRIKRKNTLRLFFCRVHSDAKFILLTAMLFIPHSSQSLILRGLSKRITWFIKQATPINWIADTTIKIAIKWIVSVK